MSYFSLLSKWAQGNINRIRSVVFFFFSIFIFFNTTLCELTIYFRVFKTDTLIGTRANTSRPNVFLIKFRVLFQAYTLIWIAYTKRGLIGRGERIRLRLTLLLNVSSRL